MKKTPTTMDDISRECGLSKMTVSRVLTGRGKASAKTKDLILRTAKRLNYEVNALARNLSTNRSGFIGIATPFEGLIGSNYFAEVFKGLQMALRESPYEYALFDTLQDSFNDGRKLAKLYNQRKVDGLLIVAPHTHDYFLSTLTGLGIPLVVIGENHPSKAICSVSCEDGKGIKLLCEYLLSLGHKKIGFVEGPADLASAQRRKDAFRTYLLQHKVEIQEQFVRAGDYTMKAGREAGRALLSAAVRPTAIVAANDLMAYGVIESARQFNFQVPQDISVVGFDDLPTAAERYPALTTVSQPIAEMARQGAAFLLEAFKENRLPKGSLQFPVSLVVRQSAAPPRPSVV